MKRRTFEIVHNIPSPYRLHLFGALQRELASRGVDLFVHFFAAAHRDRPSSWSNPQISFPHRFWKDFGPQFGNLPAHFNPGLISSLRSANADYLMVGGPWDTPTGLLTSLLARRQVGIAWVEGNTITPGRIKGLSREYKSRVLKRYDFVAVPGMEGARYVELVRANIQAKGPKTVLLPNLVDESRFCQDRTASRSTRADIRRSLGISAEEQLAVWPARMHPVKGIIEFLSAVDVGLLSGWKILIIGEGTLEVPITKLIQARGLSARVLLSRCVEYEKMPDFYSAADLFILASLYDPNPLSVVEAMHSGLPLLLSNRVGNFPEALAEGENGWGFAPADHEALRTAAARAFSASQEELRAMGAHSALRARAFWNTHQAVRRFVDSVGIGCH